ncbi:hypothetical protein IWX78_001281 [Mycetocola sp. CAN_C7]|uniref:DUF6993 domain-containing protein n=1 Tax=Mycetocola sp. CAN_C7 TaxID=2787724 RepID=UPI001A1E8897
MSACGAMTGIALVVLLAGCSPTPAEPSAPPTSSTPTATPPAAPSFDPDAPADEAILFFDTVNTATLAANASADGRAFIDGLVAAGFDKTTMEVTADATTIGNAADSIQFSVRWGDSCLIGQNGAAVNGYHSTVGPLLGTGTCLIGSTRPIDW